MEASEWEITSAILALSALTFLNTRKITNKYPLFIFSALAFVSSAYPLRIQYATFLVATILLYVAVRDAVTKGYLSESNFRIVFDRKILLLWFAISVVAKSLAYIPFHISMLFLSQTFAMVGISRRRSSLRAGDFEAMYLSAILIILADFAFLISSDHARYLGFCLIYTASILYLLTRIRY